MLRTTATTIPTEKALRPRNSATANACPDRHRRAREKGKIKCMQWAVPFDACYGSGRGRGGLRVRVRVRVSRVDLLFPEDAHLRSLILTHQQTRL